MSTSQVIALIIGILLSISEGLALIPSVKANSIFQLIVNVLKAISGKSDDQSAAAK
jgi:ABC-type methionine transport system permease subunit